MKQPETLPEEPEFINFSSYRWDGDPSKRPGPPETRPEPYGFDRSKYLPSAYIIPAPEPRKRHWAEYVMIAIGLVGILMWAYIIITALVNPFLLEQVSQCLAAVGN